MRPGVRDGAALAGALCLVVAAGMVYLALGVAVAGALLLSFAYLTSMAATADETEEERDDGA